MIWGAGLRGRAVYEFFLAAFVDCPVRLELRCQIFHACKKFADSVVILFHGCEATRIVDCRREDALLDLALTNSFYNQIGHAWNHALVFFSDEKQQVFVFQRAQR